MPVRSRPSTSQKRTERAELALDQAGQPDRDDEEEADREDQREGDRQAPDPAADLFRLAVLVVLDLRVGGDRQGAEADLHRFGEGDDAADDRHPPEAVALRPRGERLGLDFDLALGCADGDGPGRDAAHHHSLEHRLAADRRVAFGDQPAVGHAQRVPSGTCRLEGVVCGACCAEPAIGLTVTTACRPGVWPGDAGTARRDHRCRPASVCRCRTGGTRSKARRAGRLSSTACRTGCRTSSARWRGCNRGGLKLSLLGV